MPSTSDCVLSLRPYQAEGLDFLVDHRKAALFDEPGLGKTMQALLAMRDLAPNGQLLVVATGDATGVWQDEAALWLGEEAGVYSGLKPAEAELDRSLVITNYHRLATSLTARRWTGVIFDEAQALRNRKTRTLFATVRKAYDQQRTGLWRVPSFFLSGTPIVKAAGDLWPILHLIDKRAWSSYWKFVQRHAIVWQDSHGWHVEGVQNTPRLWAEVGPHCLRRTVDEVQPDLPPLVRQRVRLKMTPAQARLYYDLEDDWIAEIEATGGLLLAPTVLALETRLRQILVTPRLVGADEDGAALDSLVEIAGNGTKPFVAFTAYPSAFPYFEHALAKVGRPTFQVQGGMGAQLALEIKGFKEAAKAGRSPILIASVHMAKAWDVAQYTNEDYVLGADWNGTTMTQAESRLRRGGQLSTVFSRYLCHEGTIDFHVLDVFTGKLTLAKVILDRARLGHKATALLQQNNS